MILQCPDNTKEIDQGGMTLCRISFLFWFPDGIARCKHSAALQSRLIFHQYIIRFFFRLQQRQQRCQRSVCRHQLWKDWRPSCASLDLSKTKIIRRAASGLDERYSGPRGHSRKASHSCKYWMLELVTSFTVPEMETLPLHCKECKEIA